MRLLQQLQFYCYHHCLVDAFFFLSSQRPRLSHLEEAWKEAALPTGGGAEGESAGPGARVPGQLVAARESSGLGPLRPALRPRRLSVGWGRSLFPPAPPASTHCFAKQARRRRASSEGQASPASESNFCSEPHSPTRVVARFFFKGAALT